MVFERVKQSDNQSKLKISFTESQQIHCWLYPLKNASSERLTHPSSDYAAVVSLPLFVYIYTMLNNKIKSCHTCKSTYKKFSCFSHIHSAQFSINTFQECENTLLLFSNNTCEGLTWRGNILSHGRLMFIFAKVCWLTSAVLCVRFIFKHESSSTTFVQHLL